MVSESKHSILLVMLWRFLHRYNLIYYSVLWIIAMLSKYTFNDCISDLQSVFMLLLILLSMGWAVTRHELTCKVALFSLWSLYTIVHCLLYIWKKVRQEKRDMISNLLLFSIWFRLQFETFLYLSLRWMWLKISKSIRPFPELSF